MNLKGEFSILLRGEKDRRTPMKSLNEDIKTGNFKPVYLLYGEEAYPVSYTHLTLPTN